MPTFKIVVRNLAIHEGARVRPGQVINFVGDKPPRWGDVIEELKPEPVPPEPAVADEPNKLHVRSHHKK
jgi:hypothetical protein